MKAARLLFQLPSTCRVFIKLQPAVQWGWNEILANRTNYLLEMLVWIKTKDAQKRGYKRNRPKPFVPDFMRTNETASSGAEAHTVDDVRQILELPREKLKQG